MAIDPKLLVIKPVDELTEVTGLQDGDLLFYDGSGNLKRISIDTFNNLSKTAKPLKPTDATPTVIGLYMPTVIGTYTNAGGLIAENGFDTLFYFDGINWTKRAFPYPQATKSIPQFANLSFPVTNTATEKVQCVDNFVPYQLLDGKTSTSANTPSTSPTIWKPLDNRNLRIYEDLPNGTILNPKEQVISNNVQYIVLQQAVVGTDLPTGAKFEALSDKEAVIRSKKYTHQNNKSLNIVNGTDLTYSNTSVGNLGSDFTISLFVTFNNLTAGTTPLIYKGDYNTNGWGLVLTNSGLNLIVNGVSTLIMRGIKKNTAFITLVSSTTDIKIYGWGKLHITIPTTTTTASTGIKIKTTQNYTNDLWLNYISIDSRVLSNYDINNELDLIIGEYRINDLLREFIGSSVNLSTNGYLWKDVKLSGTAVLKDIFYPTVKTKNNSDILTSVRDYAVNSSFLSSTNIVSIIGSVPLVNVKLTDYLDVSRLSQIEIVNTVENDAYYNAFYDENYNVISLIKSGTTNNISVLTPSKILDVPFNAKYARVHLGDLGYVKGINLLTFPTPTIYKDSAKEAIAIERIAPVLYDGIFDTISSQTPNVVKLFTPVSSTSTYIELSQQDMDTFTINGDLYPLAVKDTTGKYHFENVICDKNNLKLIFETPISYDVYKFMSVYDTTLSQQGQHLSHYGNRALGERIVESINNYNSYKNLGSVGCIAHTSRVAQLSTSNYRIEDTKNQAVFNVDVKQASFTRDYTNEELTWKFGLSNDYTFTFKGTTTIGEVATLKTKYPVKDAFLEIIIENAVGTMNTTGYVAVSTANLVIENNGVEIYNAQIKKTSYEKISIKRTDWGNVTFRIISNDGGNMIVYIKSILFFKVDPLQKLNPITSSSTVAVIADSWGVFPVASDPTIEPTDDFTQMIGASTGNPVYGVLGYMPKMIATRTGATVDNWSVGGMTASYGYSKMWDILNRKRYTHIVIGFFTNDNNLSTHRDWEGYIRLMVKMAVNAGVQPIVISPMGTASIGQRRSHGGMANIIRRGVFEI